MDGRVGVVKPAVEEATDDGEEGPAVEEAADRRRGAAPHPALAARPRAAGLPRLPPSPSPPPAVAL
jgi:hypothetical protein